MRKKVMSLYRGMVLALPIICAVPLTGCGKQTVMEVPELIDAVGVDMDTEQVRRMDLSGVVSYYAQIVPDIKDISFMTSGNIEELRVSIGDHVKKGQLLATLSGTSGQAKTLQEEIKSLKEGNEDANNQSRYDIDMLKENLKDLKKQLKTTKGAGKKRLKGQITEVEENIKIAEEKLKQQKELQQLEIRQKEKELAEARSSVKNSKLYSPIEGEVVGTAGGSGYMVQGGNTAVQVANMDAPRIRTDYISSTQLAKASRYVALIEGKEYEIQEEEQELDRKDIEMGVYPSETWFDFVDKNIDVKVGTSASVNLYTDAVENALVVPVNAVFGTGAESYVYLVEGEAKTKVSVKTGTKTDAYVQITEGVEEGDVVYVEG